MVALIISSFCLRSRLLVIATFLARTGSATVWFSLVLRLPVSLTSLMFSQISLDVFIFEMILFMLIFVYYLRGICLLVLITFTSFVNFLV